MTTNAKNGKNGYCSSTWHIKNSNTWYEASKAIIISAITFTLFFLTKTSRLKSNKNSMQAISNEIIPSKFIIIK